MSRRQLQAELSQYELLRVRNMEDNKTMLSKLMADLEGMKKPMVEAPAKKSKPKKRESDPGLVMRRNPGRASRRFSSLGLPATTRLSSRRGSFSSTASSDTSSTDNSPVKEGGQLVVKFGGFKFSTPASKRLGEDWEEELDQPRRAPRAHRDIRSVEDITEEDVDMVATGTGEKTYDSYYGSSCHQCRQKTLDQKTICRSDECFGVRGQFCGPCLRNRYGEDAKEALKDPEWECPPCRGICNCSFCRKKSGKGCTGILIHLARQMGHNDVNSYLQSLMR